MTHVYVCTTQAAIAERAAETHKPGGRGPGHLFQDFWSSAGAPGLPERVTVGLSSLWDKLSKGGHH